MHWIWQNWKGTLCFECNVDHYPLIGLCLECPDRGAGATTRNIGNMIAIYGGIWLMWLLLNRVLCEKLIFMDSIINFCQVWSEPATRKGWSRAVWVVPSIAKIASSKKLLPGDRLPWRHQLAMARSSPNPRRSPPPPPPC